MGGADGTATQSEGGAGVSAADRDWRGAAADAQPCDREREGAAADRALAHAAGPGGDHSGLGAVARTASRGAGPSLGGVGLAGVLRGGGGDIAELSGGVAGADWGGSCPVEHGTGMFGSYVGNPVACGQ